MLTTCGSCGGRGWVLGPAYDREGRAQEPPRRWCEHCNGNGACESGDILSPSPTPNTGPEHAEDMKRAGNPAWG